MLGLKMMALFAPIKALRVYLRSFHKREQSEMKIRRIAIEDETTTIRRRRSNIITPITLTQETTSSSTDIG
jgi:hypothetical protein